MQGGLSYSTLWAPRPEHLPKAQDGGYWVLQSSSSRLLLLGRVCQHIYTQVLHSTHSARAWVPALVCWKVEVCCELEGLWRTLNAGGLGAAPLRHPEKRPGVPLCDKSPTLTQGRRTSRAQQARLPPAMLTFPIQRPIPVHFQSCFLLMHNW